MVSSAEVEKDPSSEKKGKVPSEPDIETGASELPSRHWNDQEGNEDSEMFILEVAAVGCDPALLEEQRRIEALVDKRQQAGLDKKEKMRESSSPVAEKTEDQTRPPNSTCPSAIVEAERRVLGAVTEKEQAVMEKMQEANTSSGSSAAVKPGAVAVRTTTAPTEGAQVVADKTQDADGSSVAPAPVTPGAVAVQGIDGASSVADETTISTGNEDVATAEWNDASGTPLIAVKVEEDEERARMEQELRQKIMKEVVDVEADPVPEGDNNNKKEGKGCRKDNKALSVLVVLVVVAVALAVGLTLGGQRSNSDEEKYVTTTTTIEDVIDDRPTMERIRDRGFVRCGIYEGKGFALENPDTGKLEGINADQCRALSVALFGTPDNTEMTMIVPGNRFQLLVNRSLDVLTETTTHTMSRDIWEGTTQHGLTFSIPYLYAGLAFAGQQPYLDCAENLDDFNGPCRDLRICVTQGTTHQDVLTEVLPGPALVPGPNWSDLKEWMRRGDCNVVAGESTYLGEVLTLNDLDYQVGSRMFSREPLSLVTRGDDAEWSNLVNAIVNVFFLAEAHQISKPNAHDIHALIDDNQGLASTMEAIIFEFGHYGDMWERHMESVFPRIGINRLYDIGNDTSGLLYYMPLGTIGDQGPDPLPGSTMGKVLDRGYLRCGVNPRYVASQLAWLDFDMEFCKALAASLFRGIAVERNSTDVSEEGTVEFVYIPSSTEAFSDLAAGAVDVIAGAKVTIEADYLEPTTGQGYEFSEPYFYDHNGDAFSLMTREGDAQWSDLTYLIVMAAFYAEDEGIGRRNSIDMPVVGLFGENQKQLLRDCIHAVGSYGEMYNRTMQSVLPRSGRNLLNLSGPQQYPLVYN